MTPAAVPDSIEEWEALGGQAAADCLEFLARVAGRGGGDGKAVLRHAFMGPDDDEEMGKPTAEQIAAEGDRVRRWKAEARRRGGDEAAQATPPRSDVPFGPPVTRRVVQETPATFHALAAAVRSFSPSCGEWACPRYRQWLDAAKAKAEAESSELGGLEWRIAMLEARAAREAGAAPPLSSAMPRGIVRRAISALLANEAEVRRAGPALARPVDLATVPSLMPAMQAGSVRKLLGAFDGLRRGGPSGELRLFELDVKVTADNDAISDSLFLPLLFRLVRARRHGTLDPMEFVAWAEMLCVMSEQQLLHWTFRQMAALRPRAPGVPREVSATLPAAIVLPRLPSQFKELKDAHLRANDPNLGLLKALQRRARHNQRARGPLHEQREAVFARLVETGAAPRLGATRASELLFETDFFAALAASPQCVFALQYIRSKVVEFTLGRSGWGRRRREVLAWAERHRSGITAVLHGEAADGVQPVNGGWGLRMHAPSIAFLLAPVAPRHDGAGLSEGVDTGDDSGHAVTDGGSAAAGPGRETPRSARAGPRDVPPSARPAVTPAGGVALELQGVTASASDDASDAGTADDGAGVGSPLGRTAAPQPPRGDADAGAPPTPGDGLRDARAGRAAPGARDPAAGVVGSAGAPRSGGKASQVHPLQSPLR